ncbi:hypothetical protein T492DRAFT_850319 [Pavlovales sp. CCMP2436]|nr:hypothetical protein T492DRAFT_850319 [Pavlovales sp. CCMP2436]
MPTQKHQSRTKTITARENEHPLEPPRNTHAHIEHTEDSEVTGRIAWNRKVVLQAPSAEAYYEHLDKELLPPTSHVRKWFEAKLYAVRAWHALHAWADRVRDDEPDAVYALPTRVQPWGVGEREKLCAELRGAGHAHVEGMILSLI